MMNVRKSEERGLVELDWLKSRHTFSFGHYYDPKHMGYSVLRVINEDEVQPKGGFPTHGHRDMEIVSYVTHGGLEHKDSMGNGTVIKAGDVQRMTAGTGVTHSEFNTSHTQKVRFLQIWILPEKNGLKPGYEQIPFKSDQKRNTFCPIATRDGRNGSLTLHQDVAIYATLLDAESTLTYSPSQGRKTWIQVVEGDLLVGDETLKAGDGLAIENLPTLQISGISDCEFLTFDLP